MVEKKKEVNKRNILSKYLNDIENIPVLSIKEEKTLARNYQNGDKQAFSKLIKANLKFVVFIAREYQERGLPLDELICEGNFGLLEAAKRFDIEKGNKFISYAVWWIRQSILKALANNSRLVRLPINHVWACQKFVSIVDDLQQDLGRAPELIEIAKELEISPNALLKNMSYWGRELSLEDSTRPNEESLQLIDKISSNEFESPTSELIKESMKSDINSALNSLTATEENILRLYYGIERDRSMTLIEIGDRMNLSRERIRQIKKKALQKLRYFHRRETLRPYLD